MTEGKIGAKHSVLSYILITLGFYFFFNGIASIIIELYFGKMPDDTDILQGGNLIKNTIFIGQIGGIIFGMILLPYLYIHFLNKELKFTIFKPSWENASSFFLIAIAITIIILPTIGIIGDWNKAISLPEWMKGLENSMKIMEEKAAEMTDLIIYCSTPKEYAIVLFTVAFLPALSEELVFRGILLNGLKNSIGNVHIAILISAAIFSFIHMQFFGFFPRMILGIVLGYLYISSGNLLVSMLMHFTNNAMVIVVLNLQAQKVIQMDMESSKDLPIESIYISIVLSIALLYYCWTLYKNRNIKYV